MRCERALSIAAFVFAASCAGAPTQTYPGPERPLSEIALLTEQSNAKVLSIDGARVSGNSWSLLPGPHEVWLRIRIYTQAPNMTWNIWSYCLITLDAVAGEQYVSRVRTREEVAPGVSERVKMEVGIADSRSYLRAMPSRCSPERPDLDG